MYTVTLKPELGVI